MTDNVGPTFVAVTVGLIALGCDNPDLKTSGGLPTTAQLNADVPDIPEFTLPDLTELSALVQEQINDRHALVIQRTASRLTAPRQLGDAYGDLGLVLMATGYYEAAVTAYLRAQALAPAAVRWPYYLGHLYGITGRPADATVHLERALELQPNRLATVVALGENQLDQSQVAEAEGLFAHALELAPTSGAALAGAGRVAAAQNNHPRAIEFLEQALSHEPTASSLHYPLAMSYRALGDVKNARTHLSQRGHVRATPPDPLLDASDGVLRSTMAFEIRGMQAMEARRPTEAAAIFREGLALAPNDPYLRHRLGTVLMMSGDTAAAVEQLHAVLEISPDFARAHFGLGVIESVAGQPQEAIAHFAAAVEHQPNYLEGHLGLAEALRATGRLSEAAASYERVIAIDPSFAEGWVARAVTLLQLERHKDAREWLREALLVHPGHPDLTDLRRRLGE